MNKKILIGTVGTVALVGLSFAAVNTVGNAGHHVAMEGVRSAVEAGDYTALPEAAQTKISESQFAQMVERRAEHEAEKTAVENNDYPAFREAKIAQIPTEEEFADMVTRHAEHEAAQTAIQDAIKNNDFVAFKAAHEAMKPDGFDNANAHAMDDTRLQKRFDTLVSQYQEDGTLPENNGFGMGGGKGGPRGDVSVGEMSEKHGPRGGH